MSKLSFRSRQVDYQKPLPIYLNQDLPDLQDLAAINRSVPQMPTGMEKDEEAEHHLQRALSAFQAFGVTSTNEYAIPTPRVETDEKLYNRIYAHECVKYKQYIRIQPFSNDYDYPDYDADDEDTEWLRTTATATGNAASDFSDDLALFFETVMDCLEKATGFSAAVMSRSEALGLLRKEAGEENEFLKRRLYRGAQFEAEKDAFLVAVYEYWRAKRLRCKHPLTPTVMTDKSGVVTAPNNPFLVFRRRTEKMQTRKNRKNEEHSYENMLILKRDLIRAQQILRFIKQREQIKKDLFKMSLEQVEKRYKLNDFDGSITESIKRELKPPLLTTNTNGTQLPLGLNSMLKLTGLDKQAPMEKQIASLIAQHKLKQQQQQQQMPKISNNNINNKRKKDGSSLAGVKLPHTTLHNVSNNNTNNIIHNSLKPSKLISGSDLARLNQQQQQQQLLNSSNNKKLTVNTSATNRSPLLLAGQVNSQNSAAALKASPNNSADAKKRNLMRKSGAGGEAVENELLLPCAASLVDLNLLKELNEYQQYTEELRLNNIENLDSVLSETKNRLSTSVEMDGNWSFKRKDGCKYLAPNGSLFKHDAFQLDENLNRLSKPEYINIVSNNHNSKHTNNSSSTNNNTSHIINNNNNMYSVNLALLPTTQNLKMSNPKRAKQLRDLHYSFYGFPVTKQNRHLGLMRRRLGRGGRIIFERFDHSLVDVLKSPETDRSANNHHSMASNEQNSYSFDAYSKFKTYYPIECFELNNKNNRADSIVPSSSASGPNKPLRLKPYNGDDLTISDNENDDEENSSVTPRMSYDHNIFSAYQLASLQVASPSQQFTNHQRNTEYAIEGNNFFEQISASSSAEDRMLAELFSDLYASGIQATDSNFQATSNTIKLDLKSDTIFNDAYNVQCTYLEQNQQQQQQQQHQSINSLDSEAFITQASIRMAMRALRSVKQQVSSNNNNSTDNNNNKSMGPSVKSEADDETVTMATTAIASTPSSPEEKMELSAVVDNVSGEPATPPTSMSCERDTASVTGGGGGGGDSTFATTIITHNQNVGLVKSEAAELHHHHQVNSSSLVEANHQLAAAQAMKKQLMYQLGGSGSTMAATSFYTSTSSSSLPSSSTVSSSSSSPLSMSSVGSSSSNVTPNVLSNGPLMATAKSQLLTGLNNSSNVVVSGGVVIPSGGGGGGGASGVITLSNGPTSLLPSSSINIINGILSKSN